MEYRYPEIHTLEDAQKWIVELEGRLCAFQHGKPQGGSIEQIMWAAAGNRYRELLKKEMENGGKL